MGEKSARKNDAEERETDGADRSAERTQREEETTGRSDAPDAPTDGVRVAGRAGPSRGQTRTERSGGSRGTGEEYVDYERGPDPRALSKRYGMQVRAAAATKLQRLESEFGGERVQRWADEGMTVEAMGKPRDMQAFRKRQAERSEEIPADVERRNEASRQRNAARNREDGPAGDAGVPDAVRSIISSPGRSIDEPIQREMETKMGADFGDVRIHTGPNAASAAESICAKAFTVGNHIAFNRGEYEPGTDGGKKLIAHELAHVRQQTTGQVSLLPKAKRETPDGGIIGDGVHIQPELKLSSPDDPAEKEAERIAEQVVERDANDSRSSDSYTEPDPEGTDDNERNVELARWTPVPPGNGATQPKRMYRQTEGKESTLNYGMPEGDKGVRRELLKNTVKNFYDDLIEKTANAAATKVGSRVPIGAVLIAGRKMTLGFAKASAKEIDNARSRLRKQEEEHVEQSDRPELAAEVVAKRRRGLHAPKEVLNVLGAGLKGAFKSLVQDVFLERLIGWGLGELADKLEGIVNGYAPKFSTAVSEFVSEFPGPIKEAADSLTSAFSGAATKMALQTAARRTNKSLEELRMELEKERGSGVAASSVADVAASIAESFVEKQEELIKLRQKYEEAEGRERRKYGDEYEKFDVLGELKDVDISDEAIRAASTVHSNLLDIKMNYIKFENSVWGTTYAKNMAKSLKKAISAMERLASDFNWPVGGSLSTGELDRLRNLRSAMSSALQSYGAREILYE
jgi:hypothetical protein